MKRRQMLVAGGLLAVGAAAVAKEPISTLGASGRARATLSNAQACALLPIEVNHRLGSGNSFELLNYLTAEAPSGVMRLDFDLQLDNAGSPSSLIYVWQARRLSGGIMSGASQLQMQFDETLELSALVTVLDDSGAAKNFGVALPRSTLMAFVTARRSTGLPPALMDLRYDGSKRLLSLSDNSPRDFEALLVRTS
jgi:hypothetical protein